MRLIVRHARIDSARSQPGVGGVKHPADLGNIEVRN